MSEETFNVGDELCYMGRMNSTEIRTVAKVHKKYIVDSRGAEWSIPNLRRRGGSTWDTCRVERRDPNDAEQNEALAKAEAFWLRKRIETEANGCENVTLLRDALSILERGKR